MHAKAKHSAAGHVHPTVLTQAGVAVAAAVEHVRVWQLPRSLRHLKGRVVILQGGGPVTQALVGQAAACEK